MLEHPKETPLADESHGSACDCPDCAELAEVRHQSDLDSKIKDGLNP